MTQTTMAPFRIADGQFICSELELALPMPPWHEDVHEGEVHETVLGLDCRVWTMRERDTHEDRGVGIQFPNGFTVLIVLPLAPVAARIESSIRAPDLPDEAWQDVELLTARELLERLIEVSQREGVQA